MSWIRKLLDGTAEPTAPAAQAPPTAPGHQRAGDLPRRVSTEGLQGAPTLGGDLRERRAALLTLQQDLRQQLEKQGENDALATTLTLVSCTLLVVGYLEYYGEIGDLKVPQ